MKNFTDVLYTATQKKQNSTLNQEIDAPITSDFAEFEEVFQLLEKAQFEPKNETINKILEYSRTYSQSVAS